MSMPTLPTGFTWSVELANGGDTAVVHIHENGPTLLSKEVNVKDMVVEADFVAAIEGAAQTIFGTAQRYIWIKAHFS